jgi:hypothetical protein
MEEAEKTTNNELQEKAWIEIVKQFEILFSNVAKTQEELEKKMQNWRGQRQNLRRLITSSSIIKRG